jgi:paraquat-inducible protein B
MSKQASKTVIGAFVVGALALVVVGILMFGSGKFLKKSAPCVMYFEGSVSGLSVGAPVVFRGVKIGSVTDIQLIYDRKDQTFQIPVYAQIEPERAMRIGGEPDPEQNFKMLVEKGLRAQLATQSFVTGQLMVSLDLFPDKPAELHGDGTIPEIPTVPTTLQLLAKKLEELRLEEIVKNLSDIAEGVNRLVNSPELRNSLESLEKSMKEIQQFAGTLNEGTKTVLGSVEDAVKDYGKLAKTLDGQLGEVGPAAKATVQDFGKLARSADGQMSDVATSVKRTLGTANAAMEQAQRTLLTAQKVTDENSPMVNQVTIALEELALAARSIRALADYLERHPEALIQGKGSPKGR